VTTGYAPSHSMRVRLVGPPSAMTRYWRAGGADRKRGCFIGNHFWWRSHRWLRCTGCYICISCCSTVPACVMQVAGPAANDRGPCPSSRRRAPADRAC